MALTGSERVVLLVERDPDAREALAEALRSSDVLGLGPIRTVLAADERDALRVVSASSPDVVLLGIRRPGEGQGLACRVMGHAPGGRGVPVVVLGTVAQGEGDLWAGREGCAGYLAKPCGLAALAAVLRPLLARERPRARTTLVGEHPSAASDGVGVGS